MSGAGSSSAMYFALFGTVAVLLTATVALTLSRATPLASGIDGKAGSKDAQSSIDRQSL